jgi:hypothetical protein
MRFKLLSLSAEVLVAAGDADIVFVGRSPENLHDFLRGALAPTSFAERIQLLQLSLRDHPRALRHRSPEKLERLGRYLAAVNLAPRQILDRPRPVAFTDLVCSGETFRNLVDALRLFSGAPRVWSAVRERLRWVCLVSTEPGYSGWEPDDSRWTQEFPASSVRRVRLDRDFWHYLGDTQTKTTDRWSEERWATPGAPPDLEGFRFEAIRLARAIYRLGECWREPLAARLDEHVDEWLGPLVRELRTSPR